MSLAREDFHRSLQGIDEAIALEPLAQGGTNAPVTPGVFVLRRGILVASLIALETFVRTRTTEALRALERWPNSFEDLPEKLRSAARLNAISHLHQFAKMLKRQGQDYEAELREELKKMSSGHQTVQQFTKFVSGDHTGNLSDTSIKELLSSLQIKDAWESFRQFAADAGIGVPSVHEIIKNIVNKRHRSAHSASFAPTPTDISGLRAELLCIAMCFDVAVTASMEQALSSSRQWADGECEWRNAVNLYILAPSPRGQFRLAKFRQQRALRLVADVSEAKRSIPLPRPGEIAVLVIHNSSGSPLRWDIR